MTELSELYKKLQQQITVLEDQIAKEAEKVIKTIFDEFFTKYSDVVTCIYWRQATPFFNDGEECVFTVSDIYMIPKLPFIADFDDWEEFTPDTNWSSIVEELTRIAHKIRYDNDRENYIKTEYDSGSTFQLSNYDRSKSLTDLLAFHKRYEDPTEISAAIFNLYCYENYPELTKDFNSLVYTINSINPEHLKMSFGDHAKVIITADSVTVEEYLEY